MLRHSLRVRLLLPVLALVLAVVVAATLVLATTEASRVRAEASTAIDRQTSALQSLFSVTRSIMLERVHNAMRLLRKEGDTIGQASVGGQIEDVVFSRHRSDEAVQLLAKVPAGRARFQADPAAAGAARVSLGEASLSWLMGGVEKSAATAAATPAAPRLGAVNVNVQGLSEEQRATIERIALNYLGPIAALLCDEALGVPGSIDRALVQIASNLPARDQEDQFLAEARAALGLRG